MDSINKLLDYKRLGYAVIAFAVMLATVLPSLALAAQVTDRSIALSTSSVEAKDVVYQVNFTPATDAGAVVVHFCSDSPALGATCTAPDAMFTAAGTAGSGGFTVNGTPTANKVVLAGTITAASPVSFTLNNIDNPEEAGPLYARIVTFDTTANAQLYTATSNTSTTGYKDSGGVAMNITPTIGVSGSVSETLIFCASGTAIDPSCGGTPTAPNVRLGDEGVLTTAEVDTDTEGTVYSQVSTNAVSGAVVSLKSSAAGCGGLLRAGPGTAAERCGIGPQTTLGVIAADSAKFGVRLTGLDNGTGEIAIGTGYSLTQFFMNYDAVGEEEGVTSTYGDPIYDTADAPISNGEANLVFGANIGNDTPAGSYSADLSLIATGKF